MGHKLDLTNQKFGRLEVIKDTGQTKNGHVMWLCKCSCGNITKVSASSLKSEDIKSCGCIRIELAKKRSGKKHPFYKHGEGRTRLYRIWATMKSRCYNPNVPDYKYYGLRQIEVCDEWRNDFTVFRDWALNNGYKEDLDMDRRDRNKNYQPDNVNWLSKSGHASKTHKEEKKKKQLRIL